jgi:hypothetical protein
VDAACGVVVNATFLTPDLLFMSTGAAILGTVVGDVIGACSACGRLGVCQVNQSSVRSAVEAR